MYLDWQKKDAYVIDIETDDLNATVIHVMCWRNVKTGETGECTSIKAIQDFFTRTHGSYYIGHNILKFDGPVLVRLANIRIGVSNCIDTLVLSTLYSPSLADGHSLDSWGERLGKAKIVFNDFSKLTPEMITYCHRDVEITCELFKKLIKVLAKINFSERSIWIQHRFTVLLDRQQRNGFYFDGKRAITLYQELRQLEHTLGDQIHAYFPAKLECLATYKRAFKKDGGYSSQYLRHLDEYEEVRVSDDGSYQVFGRTPFNIASPPQRIEKLLELGWVPEEFTPKTKKGGGGNPKPFDKGKLSPSLERFLEEQNVPEVEFIAKWMSINGRANMVNTWLNEWNEDDSCIHGSLFVADTLRLRHQKPNTANIPAVRTDKEGNILYGEGGYFTYEVRDLWCARPNRILVGTDAAGLELRMLAHYLNRAEFIRQVLEGDPHQYNADLAGVSRPTAKTLLYAIQYGAQGPKVASIIKGTVKEGEELRQKFLDRLGLTEVMDAAIEEQRNGRIDLIDGSKVICPSPHSALNYKLQGGGARVMALGAILLEGYIRDEGLDSLKVGDIHDEWQYDVALDDADRHAELSVQAIVEAGRMLKMNIPLDGTAKKGLTWAQTH